MKKRLFSLLAALCLVLGCLAGCNDTPGGESTQPETTTEPEAEIIDYAGSIDLDMSSETAKQEVTVKAYVDGDTTHFYVPTSIVDTGLLKARYLAVNTPESTGKIEPWGKKASNFTKEKLSSAVSIYIESDDENWNLDSTGGRNLVWVWYKPEGSTTYRNLNIELLQNGLSIASNSAENRYGEICMAAIAQAKSQKLNMHSNQNDPDFYYGEAIPVTLKHLRENLELYEGLRVTFEGVISREDGQTVYAEEYDPETDMYYGMTIYYGYNLTGTGLEILDPGNRVAFVGTLSNSEGFGWQISDIKYVDMRPNDPNNIQLISSGHEAANTLVTPEQFAAGTMEVECLLSLDDDATETKTVDFAYMALGTSISMEDMLVDSVYTTTNETSSSKGAMSLTCMSGGHRIIVRTTVMRDENGNLITADAYEGKIINVTGVVEDYNGAYQIQVFSPDDITVVG